MLSHCDGPGGAAAARTRSALEVLVELPDLFLP
jgi:hypothetical protein